MSLAYRNILCVVCLAYQWLYCVLGTVGESWVDSGWSSRDIGPFIHDNRSFALVALTANSRAWYRAGLLARQLYRVDDPTPVSSDS